MFDGHFEECYTRLTYNFRKFSPCSIQYGLAITITAKPKKIKLQNIAKLV